MADYFAALAARTLRPDLSVRPRPRVRWEDAIEPTVQASPATEQPFSDAERPRALDSDEPSPRRLRRKPAEELNRGDEQAEPRTKQHARAGKAAVDRRETTDAIATTPHPTVRAVEPTAEVRFERVVTRPVDIPVRSPATAGDRADTPARLGGSGPGRPLPTRPSTTERAVEPVIRIHIGRVDVRAVTSASPSASPSGTRDSRRELMSIDEYVQKRDRGAS